MEELGFVTEIVLDPGSESLDVLHQELGTFDTQISNLSEHLLHEEFDIDKYFALRIEHAIGSFLLKPQASPIALTQPPGRHFQFQR